MVETKAFHRGDTQPQLKSKPSDDLLKQLGKRTLYWSKRNMKNHATKFLPFATIVRLGEHNAADSNIA